MKGFTIIEMMIVFLIIALLLGFGIPGYKHWHERATELDQRQRDGIDSIEYEMKTGRPCPNKLWQQSGIPADLLALCPTPTS